MGLYSQLFAQVWHSPSNSARSLRRLGSTTENCHEVPVAFPCYTMIVLRFWVEKIVLTWGLNDVQRTENETRMFQFAAGHTHSLASGPPRCVCLGNF